MYQHDQKIQRGEKPAKEEDDKLKKDLDISAEEKKAMYLKYRFDYNKELKMKKRRVINS